LDATDSALSFTSDPSEGGSVPVNAFVLTDSVTRLDGQFAGKVPLRLFPSAVKDVNAVPSSGRVPDRRHESAAKL